MNIENEDIICYNKSLVRFWNHLMEKFVIFTVITWGDLSGSTWLYIEAENVRVLPALAFSLAMIWSDNLEILIIGEEFHRLRLVLEDCESLDSSSVSIWLLLLPSSNAIISFLCFETNKNYDRRCVAKYYLITICSCALALTGSDWLISNDLEHSFCMVLQSFHCLRADSTFHWTDGQLTKSAKVC